MNTKSFLFVGIASILMLVNLSCSKPQSKTGAIPVQTPRTIDKIKSSNKLIVGVGMEAAPFGYKNGNKLVGFDIDIAKAVTKKLEKILKCKLNMEFRAVTDETRISWVQTGEVNMSLCHTNITRKRDANIDFSVPYGWDGKGVMYDLRKGHKDLKDFQGKTIGIKRSSSSEGEIQAFFKINGWKPVKLKQYDSHIAGIKALMDGQIDGFTDDNSIIINTAMKANYNVGKKGPLQVTKTSYSPTYFGIGVPENDSKWRDAVNYALHDLWSSGEFQKIYDKWFGPKSMCPIPLEGNKMEPFVEG